MRSSKVLTVVLCLLSVLVLPGCWNRHELDTLAIVMGVGIDKPAKAGEVQMTAQIIKAEMLKEPDTGTDNGGEKPYWNTQSQGKTVFEAVRGFTHQSSRKLFFQHNQVLVFSKEIANEGVQKYIDFFVRDHETRLNVWTLVSKDKAGDIFGVQPELETTSAQNIAALVSDQAATSQSSMVNLKDFLNRLMSKSAAPIAPLIEIKEVEQEKTLFISGTAVFKKDKMVGELNQTETRGLLWAINKVKSGIIVVKSPGGDGKVSMEIIEAKTKITPKIKDRKIQMRIKIEEEGNLSDQSGKENLTLPPAIAALQKQEEEAIRKEVLAAWTKARQYQADIFGFGDLLHEHYPQQWEKLEAEWDKELANVSVEVQVDAKLHLSGKINKPAGPE